MGERDYETRTDDAGGGLLPCPWCGEKEGDTFELAEGTDTCAACGGEREIEREVVCTVYAFRGAKGPAFDLALARQADAGALGAYLRARGWAYARAAGRTNFGTWNPPGAPAVGYLPRPGGFWVRDDCPLSDLRTALANIAAHEGRAAADVLRAIVDGDPAPAAAQAHG